MKKIYILFIMLVSLCILPLAAQAAENMELAGLRLGMSPEEVQTTAKAKGLMPTEVVGSGANTTLHTFSGVVYGLKPLTFSCFYYNGKLSDVIIDYSPDSSVEASQLTSSIADLKSMWDDLYGNKSGVFKLENSEGYNKLTWDVNGQKAGIFYNNDYSAATFFIRTKLGVDN